MPSPSKLLAITGAAAGASATFQGFNYGATFGDGTLKVYSDFEAHFKAAQSLDGTDGKFNSARLYTMLQGNTDNEPISAIPAAIKTKTSILFGLWASGGDEGFNNEIVGLQKTIDQYCDQLDGLVAGISIGSEDLYRDSELGRKAKEFAGIGPDTLLKYIEKVKKTIKGSCLEKAPLGHVDTWTAYVNGTNAEVIKALDWIGVDAYPYYEDTKPNAIDEAAGLFNTAIDNTKAVAGDTEIWITETGWPVAGKKSGDAVASTKNARTYWEEVGCPNFGKVNTWWYTLQDSNSDHVRDEDTPSFGVVSPQQLSSKPQYNLSCKGVDTKKPTSSSSTSSSSKPTSTSDSEDEEKDTDKKQKTTESASEATSTKSTGSDDEESASASESESSSAVSKPTGSAGSGSASGSDSDDSSSDNSSGSGSGAGSSTEGGDSGDKTDSNDSEETPETVDSAANGVNSVAAVVVALGMAIFAL